MIELHTYTHSDTFQNSVEVGQTSKGKWYIKSIKLYFQPHEPPTALANLLDAHAEATLLVLKELPE